MAAWLPGVASVAGNDLLGAVGAFQLIFECNTAAAVTQALSAAHSGDVILLAPGRYGTLLVDGVRTGGNVTIASANERAPAVIEFLYLRSAQGLTFSGLEISMDPGGGQGVRVMGSSDIRLENLDVHGVLDGDVANEGTGVLVTDSTNVTVADSKLHDLVVGVSHVNADGLKVTGNEFYVLRSDGVLGSNSSDVLISRNSFTDFYPNATDHADAVQFWQTTGGETNITITDNTYIRGAGRPAQGIFITGTVNGYQNVVISGNAIIGGLYHGINVHNATNLDIIDNLVVGYQDQASWIRALESDDVLLANNTATQLLVEPNNTSVVSKKNTTIPRRAVGDAQDLWRWKQARQPPTKAR
jgi:hypothetical protein